MMVTGAQAREVFLKMEREAERLLDLAMQCETQEAARQIFEREQIARDLAVTALEECRQIAEVSAAWN